MDLKIFDVEHGACALLTCDDNTHMMIDCGHNSTTGWYPGSYLRAAGITKLDMLAITNYDEDHVSGLINLDANVYIDWLWRNPLSTRVLKSLKSEGMGRGIDQLCDMINHRFTGNDLSTLPHFSGITRRVFHNQYPTFDDENNLSMVIYLECFGVGFLFPGDLERAGWLELIKLGAFRNALAATNVLVASHHGRESGCCDEAMNLCPNINVVVISDKGHEHETQQTLDFYASYASGTVFRGNRRRVLTTRHDGRIGFSLSATARYAY